MLASSARPSPDDDSPTFNPLPSYTAAVAIALSLFRHSERWDFNRHLVAYEPLTGD